MQPVDTSQILAQMRALAAQAQAQALPEPARSEAGGDFLALLKQSLDKVNSLQSEATSLATAFERGDPGVDLAQVMVAVQKASVSFQAATQVRNRLVSAYQDVMNMPI